MNIGTNDFQDLVNVSSKGVSFYILNLIHKYPRNVYDIL